MSLGAILWADSSCGATESRAEPRGGTGARRVALVDAAGRAGVAVKGVLRGTKVVGPKGLRGRGVGGDGGPGDGRRVGL